MTWPQARAKVSDMANKKTHRETFNVQARRLTSSSNGSPLGEWRTIHGMTGYASQSAAEDAAGEWLVSDWPSSQDDAIQTRVISGTF